MSDSYIEPEIITSKNMTGQSSGVTGSGGVANSSDQPTDPKAIISVVLASLGFLINLCVPFCGILFTGISIVLSMIALLGERQSLSRNSKTMHIVALVLNAIGILIFILMAVLPILLLGGFALIGSAA